MLKGDSDIRPGIDSVIRLVDYNPMVEYIRDEDPGFDICQNSKSFSFSPDGMLCRRGSTSQESVYKAAMSVFYKENSSLK